MRLLGVPKGGINTADVFISRGQRLSRSKHGGSLSSAVLFIFYLSCALKESPDEQVPRDLQAFLEVFYADDLSYATTSYEHRESIKAETPRKLEKYNLFTNHSKTEEGEAPDKRPLLLPSPTRVTNYYSLIWTGSCHQ